MTPSVLSQHDLDEIARDCADQERRDRALTWRCIFFVVGVELIIGIVALVRWLS